MSGSLIQEFLEFIATFLLINGLMKKGTKSLAHYCFHRVDHLFKNVLFLKYNVCELRSERYQIQADWILIVKLFCAIWKRIMTGKIPLLFAITKDSE